MTWMLLEYVAEDGSVPFGTWFAHLNARAAARVTTALYRLEHGYRGGIKSVGSGIFEYKIDFGPGYRIYFAQEGKQIILLLGGGIKKGQHKDIQIAHQRRAQYRRKNRKSDN